jgi:tetratricopeptide (TPR) repeat protein
MKCIIRAMLIALAMAACGLACAWMRAADDDDERERQAQERFRAVLERNPRRGTALDRLYGYHVEQGTLDKLVGEYRKRTEMNARDGVAWMMIGLLEAQRGRDAAAVAAFQQAETHRSNDPLASYYLGQSQVVVGQTDAAVEALERAIAREEGRRRDTPNRADLLDMFQALARVHQRAHHFEKSLAVWQRLEESFPNDLRVLEQIATALAEEGQEEQALRRFEVLIKKTADQPERQTPFRLEAAGLKMRMGKASEALANYEDLLGKLKPDSFFHRETRRQIEEVFRRNDDLAGLSKYYEGWIGRNADDVESMGRLARVLAQQGRIPEAQTWLDRAIQRDPKRKELRLAMIEHLVAQRQIGPAIAQYEELNKEEPNNPDYLREWGRLLLRDNSRPEAERRQQAASVWRRLLPPATSGKDARSAASATVRVAELFRQASLTNEAIALYRQAIELAPANSEYREYLGEYYHSLNRSQEALATWRENVSGDRRDAKNLARLGEILAGFGYLKEAIAALGEACDLDKNDFNVRIKYAETLQQAAQYTEALQQLEKAGQLAANDDDAETVLALQIKNYQLAEALPQQIDKLRQELKESKDTRRWYRLVRYLEGDRQLAEGAKAVEQLLTMDPRSITAWTAAARIHEAAGDLEAAAKAYRRLADLDRRNRTEYFTSLAKLESRLGRTEPALQAGRDAVTAASGNPQNYRSFAELCFQLGAEEEGLEALRRAVRVDPSDEPALLALSSALADRFRTGEAIELYWRAFDRAGSLQDKLAIVPRLADLYLQTNQFERLLERLQHERYETDLAAKQRERIFCLAEAYHAAGDLGTARSELERLLPDNPRDTQLLQLLTSLAESERDISAAIQYQRQLVQVVPGKESETRLANLLMQSGEAEEAGAIWTRLAEAEQEPVRILQASDHLLAHEKYSAARSILGRLLRDQPRNWEALYREGLILAATAESGEAESGHKEEKARHQVSEAAARFQQILDLRLPDDEISKLQAAIQQRARATNSRVGPTAAPADFPLKDRMDVAAQIREQSGLAPPSRFQAAGVRRFWSPADYGQARMAALAWLNRLARKDQREPQFLQQAREARDRAGLESRSWWDWLYLQVVRGDAIQAQEAARVLSKRGDLGAQWYFVTHLASTRAIPSLPPGSGPVRTEPEPLPGDEVDHLMVCFRNVQRQRPDWLPTQGVFTQLLKELKRAGRAKEADEIYRQAMASVLDPRSSALDVRSAAGVLEAASDRGDADAFGQLFDKLEQLSRKGPIAAEFPNREEAVMLMKVTDECTEAKAFAARNRVVDYFLAVLSRRHQASTTRRMASSPRRPLGNTSFYVGSYLRRYSWPFPESNAYFNYEALQVLGNAFMDYEKDDLLTDLYKHLQAGLSNPPKPISGKEGDRARLEAIHRRLAFAYLLWWGERQEEATSELALACEVLPNDLELRIDLAQLREQRNELEEAATLLDALTPLDQNDLKRRELIALRLAVRTGNTTRARQAAERLFGLRLDATTQLQLAQHMHQLGMHDLAEAVLNRARRQAGNRTDSLASLMVQYQAQNKPEVAAQIAYQILRAAPAPQARYGGFNQEDNFREQAIQVLARSGKLREMIDRAETQLKSSPRSLQLHQVLAYYYRAAGDQVKSRQIYERMAELRPDDARLHFEIARQYAESRDVENAAKHYLVAIKKEPSLYGSGNNYHQIEQTFRQAKQLDALVDLLQEMDLRALTWNYPVTNLMTSLLATPQTRDKGLRLLKKAWDAFPQERAQMLGNIYNDEIWRLPEIYDYVHQAVVPPEADRQPFNWSAFDVTRMWSGDGHVTTLVTRFLQLTVERSQLDAVTREVEQAVGQKPQWAPGKALLALLRLRRGQVDPVRPALQELLEDKQVNLSYTTAWVLGQEVEATAPDLAIRFYERTFSDTNGQRFSMDFQSSPAPRLVELYRRAGRNTDARNLILKLAKADSGRRFFPEEENIRQKLQEKINLAEQLLKLDYPLDALRMYDEALSKPADLEALRRTGRDSVEQQARQGLTHTLETLNPQALTRTLRDLLKPASKEPKSDTAVDLLLLIQPRELHQISLTSLLGRALQAASGAPEALQQVRLILNDQRKQNPRDLSVYIASALAAFAEGKSEQTTAALADLTRVVEETPLEELAAGARANARQRAEAARQLGLWLVAKECNKQTSLRATCDRLGTRALAAARRQADSVYALAILREWGQMALENGDRQTAEKHWTEMLDLVLAGSKNAPAKTVDAAQPMKTAAADSATSARSSPAKLTAAVFAATLEQFHEAVEISRLAAEHDMHPLALRSVREVLQGGPPLQVVDEDPRRRSFQPVPSVSPAPAQQVGSRLEELVQVWQRNSFSAEEIYDTLAAVVLPDGRPAEIYLYTQPLVPSSGNDPYYYSPIQTPRALTQPRSIGRTLAERAARTKRASDLQQRIHARENQPVAALPARVLQVQLGLAGGDKPGAQAALDWIGQRLQKDTLDNTTELACQAALPALGHSDLAAAAAAIISQAARSLSRTGPEPAATLNLTLARFHFLNRNGPEGGKYLREYLRVSESVSNRYNPSYGVQQRRQRLELVANEYAQAGLLNEALEALGQYADTPRFRWSDTPVRGSLVAALNRLLTSHPPAERYQLLKTWMMPTPTRKSVRLFAAFVPLDRIPPEFTSRSPATSTDVIDSLTLLTEAAKAIGKVDEITAELKKAAEEKIENAKPLWLLAEVAHGGGAAVKEQLQQFAADLAKRHSTNDPAATSSPDLWPDFLVLRMCLTDKQLSPLGEEMAKQFRLVNPEPMFPQHLEHLLDQHALIAAGATDIPTGVDPLVAAPFGGLALWQPASSPSAMVRAQGSFPSGWIAHNGHIRHLSGPGEGLLYFAYPLVGSFDFSVDVYGGTGAISYGGESALMPPIAYPQPVYYAGVAFQPPASFIRPDGFNRLTIRVQPGKVRWFVNGHMVREATGSKSANPWLALHAYPMQRAMFRNPVLTGGPQIPREIRLIDEAPFHAWNASFYGESLSLSSPEPILKEGKATRPQVDTTNFDWVVQDGVIHGRRDRDSLLTSGMQSRLYYNRPLQAGDRLRYEFYYDSDAIMVHPALDRLTFLLEPAGIRLHWMTDGPDGDSSGLATNNVADLPTNLRGQERLPLRPGAWNTLQVTITAKTAVLELNGVKIHEGELPENNNRLFSFFHYKDRTGVQVKNVVLTNSWPEKLNAEQLANLTVSSPDRTEPANRRMTSAMIGEEFFAQSASDVLQRARAMSLEQRYAFLRDWVLPKDERDTFRLAGDFTPADVAPTAAPLPEQVEAGSRRVFTGGTLDAPARLLVATAREMGKLDELAQLVQKQGAQDQRGRLALLALIKTEAKQDDAAREALDQLRPLLTKLPADSLEWKLWPEFLAAVGALDRPPLRGSALALLDTLAKRFQENGPYTPFENHVAQLQSLGRLQEALQTARTACTANPRLQYWAPAASGTAAIRGLGMPHPRWCIGDGEITVCQGRFGQGLYFALPLRGGLEVEAELSRAPHPMCLSYGGRWISIQPDGKGYAVHHFSQVLRTTSLQPPLQDLGEWYKFRLVFGKGNYQAFINGREIYTERMSDEANPWLVIQPEGWGTAGVRRLKISGNPTIPEDVPLSADHDLAGWSADYYAEPLTGPAPAWEKHGDQIFGRADKQAPGGKRESVLQYQRPLLEDGAIDYEFYYDPGTALTHPALDRLTFLLDPGGTRIHWMTDAQYERTGPMGFSGDSANVNPKSSTVPEKGNGKSGNSEPLPLKPREWNRMKLTLAGDRVTLHLNGVRICERELEPTNQRVFGLFHYADETEVRVRNVHYHGFWPRTLPGDGNSLLSHSKGFR